MKHQIYFENEQDKLPVDDTLLALLEQVVDTVAKAEDIKEPLSVEVLLTDNEGIREMNRDYREIDRATDVLSFPMLENISEATELDMEDGFLLLGNVVISLERAREQAEEYGHSFEREAAFLMAHSMYHLLGYDHERSEEEEKVMFGKQEAVLQEMGLSRS